MLFKMMKSSFVIMLAIVFSASQLCACMAPMGHARAEQHKHQSSMTEMGADHAHQHETPQEEKSDHDMHGDGMGCSHCQAPSLSEIVVAAKLSAVFSHPEIEQSLPTFLGFTAKGIEQSLPLIVRANAWLDPPPTTPLILKTRLLI